MRVLAIGDSLIKAEADTAGGWAYRFAKTLAAVRGDSLTFSNAGVSGDTVLGVRERLPEALCANPPWDLVLVGVGVNDSRRRGKPPRRVEVPLEAFRTGIRHLLCDLLRSAEVERIAVAGVVPVNDEQTAPFKEDKHYRRAEALVYADALREAVVAEAPTVFFDFTAHWQQLTEPQRRLLLPDGLHPGPTGHAELAAVALRAWDEAQPRVS